VMGQEAFQFPTARTTDPDTSHGAAVIALHRAVGNRALALTTLHQHPAGLTDFELADLTHVAQTSIGKRRGELVAAGLAEAAVGEDGPIRRPSTSRTPAQVWRLTELGHAHARTQENRP